MFSIRDFVSIFYFFSIHPVKWARDTSFRKKLQERVKSRLGFATSPFAGYRQHYSSKVLSYPY